MQTLVTNKEWEKGLNPKLQMVIMDKKDQVIATVHTTVEDADIISAAPELLEALEKAYLQIIVFLNEGDFKQNIEFDAGYIVDAIAKAKGEAK